MKSKPSTTKSQKPLTLEEKLAHAQSQQAIWEEVAGHPALSAPASAVARGMAESWGAAVQLGRKAQAYQPEEPEEQNRDLEQLLNLHSLQAQSPSSAPANLPLSTKPGTSDSKT